MYFLEAGAGAASVQCHFFVARYFDSFVLLLTYALSLMQVAITLLAERLAAQLAIKRASSSVCAHVIVQVAKLGEGFGAGEASQDLV